MMRACSWIYTCDLCGYKEASQGNTKLPSKWKRIREKDACWHCSLSKKEKQKLKQERELDKAGLRHPMFEGCTCPNF